MLETIAKGVNYKYNKSIDPQSVISECYIYVYSKLDKFSNEDELQRLMVNFINKNIIWNNSQLSKLENLKSVETPSWVENCIEDTSEQDIEIKVELEKFYYDDLATIFLYRLQEKDKIKQIVFDCYFLKGLTKGVDLAKHLKINKDYSSKYIRQLKADLVEYKNNNIK